MAPPADITKGGIRIQRDVRGNLVISCRGNGQAHVEAADVQDLREALAELAEPDGSDGPTSVGSIGNDG